MRPNYVNRDLRRQLATNKQGSKNKSSVNKIPSGHDRILAATLKDPDQLVLITELGKQCERQYRLLDFDKYALIVEDYDPSNNRIEKIIFKHACASISRYAPQTEK